MVFSLLLSLNLLVNEAKAEEVAKKKKKGSKDWSKIDFDALDKDWEDGDDPDELESEYDRMQKLMSKNKARDPRANFDPNDPASVQKMAQEMKMGGNPDSGQMVFVTLKPSNPKSGARWSKEDVDDLSAKWTALVKTASLQADFYNIGGKDQSAQSLLVSVNKPWFFQDIMKFLASQPETLKITKDQRDIYPEDILDE